MEKDIGKGKYSKGVKGRVGEQDEMQGNQEDRQHKHRKGAKEGKGKEISKSVEEMQ